MTGAPPYNAQSPTQQHQFAAYESPSKNRPYYPNNDQAAQAGQQQHYSSHPPQTPPAFGPSSVARSPHFSHASSPMPASLPQSLNGAAPPHPSHAESSAQYQGHSSGGTPQLPLPRPFSNSVLQGNGTSPYGSSTPHGHPSNRPEGHSQSPTRDPESPYRVRSNGAGYPPSMNREQRPPSPPREAVCVRYSIPTTRVLSNALRCIQNPPRAADPMSFASILSGPSEEQPARPSPQPSASATPRGASAFDPHSGPVAGTFYPSAAKTLGMEYHNHDHHRADAFPDGHRPNGEARPGPDLATVAPPAPQRKPFPPGVDAEQVNRAVVEIDNAEKSDVESPEFDAFREEFQAKHQKRCLEGSRAEQVRRKVSS